MFFHKKPPHKTGCLVCHIVASVFLFLTSVAALVGVVLAHYDAGSNTLVFGTNAASLSLIAFAISLSLLMYQCKCAMSSCDVCVMPAPPAKKR